FGDIYAWFKHLLSWTLQGVEAGEALISRILPALNEEASKLTVMENDPVACDWFNGRRTPYADQKLKGGLFGLTLGTTPAQIYKSLVEATAFGSRAIMEHIEKEGIEIAEVIGVGGISLKSPYVMQTLSDVMGVPIKIAATQQAGALGAAIGASVAAGCFDSVQNAQKVLVQKHLTVYYPQDKHRKVYDVLYNRYLKAGIFMQDFR
ncbi:MAG TPA: ribulokinase, partial [Porphyromonadaceae bacterium]|nr:ribulokinase [Porphyromonadaceae bacterium]